MSAELIPFEYEASRVRVVSIDSELEFVASDICRVLEHSNPSAAVSGLDEDERGLRIVETPSGEQKMVTVTEAGLYSLIIRSRKAEAKRFRRWITHEVLPTIRKTGGAYIAPGSQADIDLLNPDTALDKLIEVAHIAKTERRRRLELEAQAAADRPMIERARAHAAGVGEKTRQQFFREVKQWARLTHGIEVKQAQVIEFLSTRKLGLFIRGERSDSGQATASAIEKGYAVNREDTAPNGHNYITGKLTALGQQYAWERTVRFIDANGTLELPREIGAA